MTTAPGWPALLQTAAQFQSAWYFTLLLLVVAVVIAAAAAAIIRTARTMWRAGDHALALVIGGACAVSIVFFVSMAATAAIGLLLYG